MVRRPVGRLQKGRRRPGMAQGMDRRHLQGLVPLQGRQQAGQARRQHAFAGAGRPAHQQGVPAGGGDLQHPLGRRLATDLRQAGALAGVVAGWRRGGVARQADIPLQVRAQLGEAVHRQGVGAGQGGFVAVARRHHQSMPGAGRRQGAGQDRRHRAQRPGQGQLTDPFHVLQFHPPQLAAGEQDAHRDRQIETAAVLGQVRRRQIDGDALLGKAEAAVDQRRAHPVLALADRGVGQADHGEAGQPRAQMDFNAHRYGADPQGGAAV